LCAEVTPPLASTDGHDVACHFWQEIAPMAQRSVASALAPNPRLERLQSAFITGRVP
jgi:hypothetical protein